LVSKSQEIAGRRRADRYSIKQFSRHLLQGRNTCCAVCDGISIDETSLIIAEQREKIMRRAQIV